MPRDEQPTEFVLVPARVIDDHGDELVVEIEAFRSVNRMFVKRKDVRRWTGSSPAPSA
jgi:hypothetical protein